MNLFSSSNSTNGNDCQMSLNALELSAALSDTGRKCKAARPSEPVGKTAKTRSRKPHFQLDSLFQTVRTVIH